LKLTITELKKYFKNVWLGVYTILIGMKITFSHLFTKAVTIQYPDERLQLPERERNRLFVNIDDCIGCDQCARACPVDCIYLETIKVVPGDIVGRTGVTSNGKKKALYVPTFTIDIAKCCYCQLCVFPCPTECIYMTDVFEFSEYDRNKLIYEFTDMTPEQIIEKKEKLEAFNKEQEEKKAAAAKAKAEAGAVQKETAPASAKPIDAEKIKKTKEGMDLKTTPSPEAKTENKDKPKE
jgi:formate hydrogenlyase subunit 6/NADH:ubiquinone oxidoreductase subunit I